MIVRTVILLEDNGRANNVGDMTSTMTETFDMVEVVVEGRDERTMEAIGTTLLRRRESV